MPIRVPPEPDAWPFVDRRTELSDAEYFLRIDYPDAPNRQLYVAGQSGIGKSFFVRELICRFAAAQPSAICLYTDVSASALELAALEKRLAAIAVEPQTAKRSDPQQIPRDAARAAERRLVEVWKRRGYAGLRMLGALTKLDKIVNELPKQLDPYSGPDFLQDGEFWDFLVKASRNRPVLLALDNVQRQEDWSKLDLALSRAVQGFRLVVVESLQGQIRNPLRFRAFGNARKEVTLNELTDSDACDLIIQVVGDGEKERELAVRWVGRLHGHPKELEGKIQDYFKRGAESDHRVSNFEDRIADLPGRDQLILRVITMLPTALSRPDLEWLLDRLLSPSRDAAAILDDLIDARLIDVGEQSRLVSTQHDIVGLSLRSQVLGEADLDIREPLVRNLNARLDASITSDNYERVADNLFEIALPEDLKRYPALQDRLIQFIYKLRDENKYRYLKSLYDKLVCRERLQELPRGALRAILDAFQKTSSFDKGLIAIRTMRDARVELPERDLDLAKAKYLVQLFEYDDAKAILAGIPPRSDSQLVLFNIVNIEANDDAARTMIANLPRDDEEQDEYQAVMLRNCAHLYQLDEARHFVTRALSWFDARGATFAFAKATAQNNLGVVELWGGNFKVARNLLESAKHTLASLGSNEMYQPVTNLACLHALEGDVSTAHMLITAAKEQVPTSLQMDVLMIALDELIFKVMEEAIDIGDAAQKVVELYGVARQKTHDVRFYEHVAWCANQLLSAASTQNHVPISADFNKRFVSSQLCSTNVFTTAKAGGQEIPVVLQLSTHWRY